MSDSLEPHLTKIHVVIWHFPNVLIVRLWPIDFSERGPGSRMAYTINITSYDTYHLYYIVQEEHGMPCS